MNRYRNKFAPIDKKLSIYNQKIVTKLPERWVRDPEKPYPGSGSRFVGVVHVQDWIWVWIWIRQFKMARSRQEFGCCKKCLYLNKKLINAKLYYYVVIARIFSKLNFSGH